MRLGAGLLALLVSLLLFAPQSVRAHDGSQGVISWADIHWNASGTNHLEYDWYYTGHEGCQGDDACVFYTMVQRYICSGQSCAWTNVDFVGHGTVHAWQYDHSAVDYFHSGQCCL